MTLVLKLLAFATLAGFLGILWAWVPRTDLAVVLGFALLLAAYDFFVHSRRRR